MNNAAKAILVEQIDELLPQTQCGKCGHGGCQPYAEAMAEGEAHNKCPPGGEQTLVALSRLLKRPVVALEQPAEPPRLAVIREDECIGCTKCIQACPVDAIVGAARQMHGVLESECTGCELCVAPCPVDCIDIIMHPQWQQATDQETRQRYLKARASNGRQRFAAHNQRIARQRAEREANRLARMKKRLPGSSSTCAATSARTASPAAMATASQHAQLTASAQGTSHTATTPAGSATPATKHRVASGNNPMAARLEHKLSRLAADDPRRPALEKRLAEARQAGAQQDNSQQLRQLRIALAAAQERRRLAERHLKHCQRQAQAQVAQAEQALAQAQATERDINEQLERAQSLPTTASRQNA